MSTPYWPARRWPFAAALLVIVALAAGRIWLIPAHYSTDPNEGWNAFQSARVMGAGPLYPPPGGMTGNNYPPLSFFIAGGLGQLLGDHIVAGRILALLSVVATAVLIAEILRRLGAFRAAQFGGALLFLFLNATLFRAYLALDDPQWLGHALMTAAIFVLVPASPTDPPRNANVMLAALLMLAGGLIKQNLVAWPIAATLWLVRYHRRALVPWLVTGAVGGFLSILACRLAFGPDFLADTLGASRSYSLHRLARHAVAPLLVMLPMLVISRPLLERRAGDQRLDLLIIVVLVAVPLGLFQRMGVGVDYNAHFEAAIALVLACALAFDPVVKVHRWLAILFVSALLILGLRLTAREWVDMSARRLAWTATEQRVAAIPGRVACQQPALCYWAGKPFALDFFLYGQRAIAERGTPLLDRALVERRFAAAVLDPPRRVDAEHPANPAIVRIEQAMRPVFIDNDGRRLMVPRQ